MQMHLDFFVDDLEATGARAVAAGATRFDFQPNSDHCWVYADPAGHPFCLSTWDGPHLDDEPDHHSSTGTGHAGQALGRGGEPTSRGSRDECPDRVADQSDQDEDQA